jgi:hypothetical protein
MADSRSLASVVLGLVIVLLVAQLSVVHADGVNVQVKGCTAYLSWSVDPFAAVQYIEWHSESSPRGGTSVALLRRTSSYVLKDLRPNTNYQVRLKNVTVSGTISWSSISEFHTASCDIFHPY